MALTKYIAAALMAAKLPTAEVAEVVAARAERRDSIKMPTPVPTTAAKRLAKSGVTAAITFAMSSCDPEYLAKTAKDSRVTVRRAIAANPLTPEESRHYLFEWACKHEDGDIVSALAPYLELYWAVENAHKVTYSSRTFFGTLGERIVKAEDMELARQVAACNSEHLMTEMARSLGRYRPDTLSLTELVSETKKLDPVWRSYRFLSAAVGAMTHLDVETAALLVESPDAASGLNLRYTTTIEPAAIDILLAGHNDHLDRMLASAAATHGYVSEEQLNCLLDQANGQAVYELRGLSARGFTTATAERLIATLVETVGDLQSTNFVDDTAELERHAASSDGPPIVGVPLLGEDAILTVLSHGRLRITEAWLSGRYTQQPRPGEVAKVIAQQVEGPSQAFIETSNYYSNRSNQMPLMDIARYLSIEELLDEPWTDELVDSLGGAFFDRLVPGLPHDSALLKYVVARVSNTLGVTADAWEMFLSLCDNHEGSFAALLDTTRRLLRTSGQEIVLPTTEVVCTFDAEQLMML